MPELELSRQDQIEEAIGLLSHMASYRRIHFSGSERLQALSRKCAERIDAILHRDQQPSLFVGLTHGTLLLDGRPLLSSTVLSKRLIEALEAQGCGGLRFSIGVRGDELLQLLEFAPPSGERTRDLKIARARMRAAGARNIELTAPFDDVGWTGQSPALTTSPTTDSAVQEVEVENFVPVYQQLFGSVEEAHLRGASGNDVGVDDARSASETLHRAIRDDFRDLLQLVRYSDYDAFTVGHSVRVATLAVLIGQNCGFDERTITELGAAGLLHDVGKARIPEEILFKPASLTPEERRIMAEHSRIGAELLMDSVNAGPMAIGAAWGHHIRHDGGGYPTHRSWAICSQLTSLIQACDHFEALTAARPYKRALTPQRAYEIMLADRHAYHPRALGALIATLGFYPPGTHVELSDGSRGVVLSAGARVDRPIVEIQQDVEGQRLDHAYRPSIDLAAANQGELSVVRMLEPILVTSPEEERELTQVVLDAMPCATFG